MVRTWIAWYSDDPRRVERVEAQYWDQARKLGATALGRATLDGLQCRPADEAQAAA